MTTKKPHKDFPLTRRSDGRWCKKVRGKVHIFKGTADEALEEWLRVKDDLLAGRKPRAKDAEGLTVEERRIAELLVARARPMGIEAIASTLRLSPRTVRQVHEPYLVARGYVLRSSRGRAATLKARRRFGGGKSAAAAAIAS